MCTMYIGMDIHKSHIQATVINGKGKTIAEERFGASKEEIQRFVKSFKNPSVAIESSYAWMYVYEALNELGVDVTLVNVRATKVIAEARIKTDRLDSAAIAQCLRTGFIAKSYIAPKNVRDLRDLTRHRLYLTRDLTRMKNRVQSMLQMNGMKHPFTDLFGKSGREWLKRLELPAAERRKLDSWLRVVDALAEEKRAATERIESVCKISSNAMLLTTIKGIGYYSALAITAEIGDIGRFNSPKKLCSYAGLVPSTRQSGMHTYHGPTMKQCNTNLKWILIQCAHSHVRHCRSRITKLFSRVAKKKGVNKATVAAAREMLHVIWFMLSRNEPFRE